jgi:hypothetical protein
MIIDDDQIRPDDLVAFLDETGVEDLSDPGHPVFGLGGCAAPAHLFDSLVSLPWLELKARHFGDRNLPLHASTLQASAAQLDAIGAFFLSQPFLRVATLVSTASCASARQRAYDKCSDTVLAFLHQLGASFGAARITIVAESSTALDRKASYFLARPARFAGSSHDFLPVQLFRGAKASRIPGLEVADFIIQAAGAQVRSGHFEDDRHRRDFRAVFGAVPEAWVRFGHLDVAEEDHSPAEGAGS